MARRVVAHPTAGPATATVSRSAAAWLAVAPALACPRAIVPTANAVTAPSRTAGPATACDVPQAIAAGGTAAASRLRVAPLASSRVSGPVRMSIARIGAGTVPAARAASIPVPESHTVAASTTAATAPATDETAAFSGIATKSLAGAQRGIRKRCHTEDTESQAVPSQYRAEKVRGRWIWFIAYDERDLTGEFSTIAGKGLARYTQFTRPLSRKGRIKLRNAGRPDALGLRAPYFDSQEQLRDRLFSIGEDPPEQLSPQVWGDE